MTAPVAVTIGGVPVTNFEQDSFRIDSILGQTIDTATLKILDKAATLSIPELVDVIITRVDTGARIFGGLSSMVSAWPDGLSRWYQISAQDYTALLDTTLVFNSYPAGFTYAGLVGDKAIIAHLFEMSIVGAGGGAGSASEIEARTYVRQGLPSLAALFFYYTSLREALSTIASYVGWNFYVDYDKYLHYYYKTDEPAPFDLSSSPDGVTSLGYRMKRDPSAWQRDATSVRNFYVMFGANLFSNLQTYILSSNGVKTILTLGVTDIGRNVVLTGEAGTTYIRVYQNTGTDLSPVWAPLTVGIDGVEDLVTKQVLHSPTQRILTFAPVVTPPNLSNSIKVQGVYQFVGGQPDMDTGSIAKYGRTFAKRLSANDANSVAALSAKLANYKSQFAYSLNKCIVQIADEAFPTGDTRRFQCGQWVNLTNDVLGITSKGFLIHRVTTTILGGELKGYELELRDWFTEAA